MPVWSKKEDAIVLTYMRSLKGKKPDWKHLLHLLSDKKTYLQTYNHWINVLDSRYRKDKWTPDEDQLLYKAVEKHGCRWIKVSQYVATRSRKQCCDRWNLVGICDTREWTEEEDVALLLMVMRHGRKWSYISKGLSRTSDCNIKNRWNSLRRKQTLCHGR